MTYTPTIFTDTATMPGNVWLCWVICSVGTEYMKMRNVNTKAPIVKTRRMTTNKLQIKT